MVEINEEVKSKITNIMNASIRQLQDELEIYKEPSEIPKDQSQCAPAANLPTPIAVTRWLFDSGSGKDLVSKETFRGSGKKAKRAEKPVTFNTAGGKRSVNKIVECWVREFAAIAKPYIMQNGCPNVLSMGRRCNHAGPMAGQSFIWVNGCKSRQIVNVCDVGCIDGVFCFILIINLSS